MSAIVKNMKSMWNVCGQAAKHELRELGKGWAEVEAYWRVHPEYRVENWNV